MIDSVPISASPLVWIDEKIDLSTFSDRRHASRFKSLMQKLWQGMGNSLPFACQDRAATKAAYRFLSSTKIDEQTFLQGHTEATCQKVQATQEETILLLQDTTSFGYHRNNPDLVGFSGRALNASFSLYIHYGLRLGNGKYCTIRASPACQRRCLRFLVCTSVKIKGRDCGTINGHDESLSIRALMKDAREALVR